MWQLSGQIPLKWLKIDLYCLEQKCSPKNLIFLAIYDLRQYLQRFLRINLLERATSDNLINIDLSDIWQVVQDRIELVLLIH